MVHSGVLVKISFIPIFEVAFNLSNALRHYFHLLVCFRSISILIRLLHMDEHNFNLSYCTHFDGLVNPLYSDGYSNTDKYNKDGIVHYMC